MGQLFARRHPRRSRPDVPIPTGEWTGGCRNKVQYPSKKKANGALRVLIARGNVRDVATLNAYRCRSCHKYHLGNKRLPRGES